MCIKKIIIIMFITLFGWTGWWLLGPVPALRSCASPGSPGLKFKDISRQDLPLGQGASMMTNPMSPPAIVFEKRKPKSLARQIAQYAPAGLLFIFVLMTTLCIMITFAIPPLHYLAVASACFAFHLMVARLVGHSWIYVAFAMSGLLSIILVAVSFSSGLGRRFPWKLAVAGQLFFLTLFCFTFFVRGIPGLVVTSGSVVTLSILMHVSVHVTRHSWPVSQKTSEESQEADHHIHG
jgi:hypothetical protein